MRQSSFRNLLNTSKLRRLRHATQDRDDDHQRPEDFSPTDALPGTQEKVRVLVERIENGLPLWHPADRATVLPTSAVEMEEDRPAPDLPACPTDELFGICLDPDDLVN